MSDDELETTPEVKVVLLGESGVGKYKTLLISHRNKNKYLNKELEITVNDYKDVHENIEISIKLSDDPEDYKEINTL